MNTYIILLLIFMLIIFLVFQLAKISHSSFRRNVFVTFTCTIFILGIVFNPKLCLNSTLEGLKLFINSVFVSVFPFLVFINIMLSYDGVNIYSKLLGNILCRPLRLPKSCSVVLIISILCGYPLGAKYACDLYERNIIDFETCERLISIASNPSPIFVLGAIGTSMMNNPSLGALLLLSTYLSCIVMALIIPKKDFPYSLHKFRGSSPKEVGLTLGDVLKDSIDNAFKTAFSIGGFIIFFSVLTAIIKNNILFDIVFDKISLIFHLDKSILESLFLGLLEMTNGCSLTSKLNISLVNKAIISGFLLGFSSLSIISQTYAIASKARISLTKYIKRKFVQGLICSLITFILYNVFYSMNVFRISRATLSLKFINNSKFHSIHIFIVEIILLFSPILIFKIIKLFRRTP